MQRIQAFCGVLVLYAVRCHSFARISCLYSAQMHLRNNTAYQQDLLVLLYTAFKSVEKREGLGVAVILKKVTARVLDFQIKKFFDKIYKPFVTFSKLGHTHGHANLSTRVGKRVLISATLPGVISCIQHFFNTKNHHLLQHRSSSTAGLQEF